jgi:hypothetical protein
MASRTKRRNTPPVNQRSGERAQIPARANQESSRQPKETLSPEEHKRLVDAFVEGLKEACQNSTGTQS